MSYCPALSGFCQCYQGFPDLPLSLTQTFPCAHTGKHTRMLLCWKFLDHKSEHINCDIFGYWLSWTSDIVKPRPHWLLRHQQTTCSDWELATACVWATSRFPTSRFHLHHLKAEPPASPQDFPLLGHQLFCADASPQDFPQLVTCITSRLSHLHHLKISHHWATCTTTRFPTAEPPASPQDFPLLSHLHHLKIPHRWGTCITSRFPAAGHLHHLKAEPPASPQDFPHRFPDPWTHTSTGPSPHNTVQHQTWPQQGRAGGRSCGAASETWRRRRPSSGLQM